METIGKVKGLGTIYQSVGPLDKQVQEFQKAGISYTTPEDVARIRLSGVSNDWSRTSMLPLKIKGEKTVLYRNSPFTSNSLMASLAVNANRNNSYLEITDTAYDFVRQIALDQQDLEPEDREAMILSQEEDYGLTPEMEEARFILRGLTKEYFKRVNHSIIPLWNLPSNIKPSKGNCIANYVHFYGPGGDSGLDLWDGDLDYDDRAFGVLRSDAEGGAEPSQNSTYSLSQIRDADDRAI